jgi:PIN domain nuclease of toxin-antitoxin system
MTRVVLDASAVLARTLAEPGADQVDALIDGAWISAVNWTEVVQRLIDNGMDDARAIATLEALPCKVATFDRTAAYGAGLLRRDTRQRGLSLGDRACLALGKRLGLPVLTADRAWAELDLGVEVVLIR